MRAEVPSPALVQARFESVFDLLQENVQKDKGMSYKDQQVNFFILQVRLNTRSGPLLQLTWEEFRIIDKTNKSLETDRHKTGKHSAVYLYIKLHQRPLRNMREKYNEENLIWKVLGEAMKKDEEFGGYIRNEQNSFSSNCPSRICLYW